MRYFRIFILLLMIQGLTIANGFSGVTPMVSVPGASATAGEQVQLKVYFHNEDRGRQTFIIPQQLQLVVSTQDQDSLILSAFSDTPERSVTLAPGQFIAEAYQAAIPENLRGVIQFSLSGYEGPEQVLVIRPPPALPAPPEPLTAGSRASASEQSLAGLESLYRAYAANFSTHEPTYFLIGTDPAKSKFQLSFKYRLFNPSGSLSRHYPWMSGFHIAYTQTSFWDLDAESIPFKDTSYKPEFLFLSPNLKWRPGWMDGFFVQTGIRHESNGRDGIYSRSTNYLYVKPIFMFYDKPSRLGLMISPRLLSYFNNDDDSNPDLADYRGYVDLEVSIGKAHSLILTTNTRFAEKGASFQADLTYPISRLLANNLDIYLHLQYSNALAESLLHYQDRTEAFRLGISLVR